ncbi:hypothetical protein DTO166G4_1581 [Paecilomyces variotii]|nr:hypothetical protein DTO032I3_7383 [Paecilomyces variotii]KAJ9198087.1 hypothetical protein DTO164E3_5343 [Paecilomyces variotii]KAJ9216735.1 hypothetical protein DTO166G4_1581 [Paecilomyces variotii]KAJ9222323.1 hypothetical protein DTO169C6_5258 [Paecilomyces variotii]KAJ9229704.1 hypothetical protein DTO169E5_8778 [Paecilomyces variotii]
MKFFGPDIWQGKEIIFPNDPNVIWVLDQKISENSIQITREESIAHNLRSVARAVFSCKQKDGLGVKHAIKIYMQIPWIDAEFTSAAARKAQADINRSEDMASEIKALRKLTQNTAKHAPHLVAELHTKQGDDGIVPTGFISYLLMTWCPGVPLGEGDYDYQTMPQAERKRIFKAFKEALEDTKRCGVVSKGGNPTLIWDAENEKCYMVDFKWSGRPHYIDVAERIWRRWGLQPGPPD